MKSENSKSEEKIDDNCSLIKNQDKLIIKLTFIDESKSWLLGILIFDLPFWVIFAFFLYFEPLSSLLSLIFLIPFTSLLFIRFLLSKNKRREWYFDKNTEVIQYKKGSNNPKILKEIYFSDINFLFYNSWEWEYPPSSSHVFTLNFLVLPNTIRIYKGQKDVCIRLGIILAQFLEKSFYYGSRRGKEQIY